MRRSKLTPVSTPTERTAIVVLARISNSYIEARTAIAAESSARLDDMAARLVDAEAHLASDPEIANVIALDPDGLGADPTTPTAVAHSQPASVGSIRGGRLGGLRKSALARAQQVGAKAQDALADRPGGDRLQGLMTTAMERSDLLRGQIGERMASIMYPGNPQWAALSVQQRANWWYWRFGPAAALVAAAPSAAGMLGSKTHLGEVVGAASQAILISAVACEAGATDPAQHVQFAAELLLRLSVSDVEVASALASSHSAEEASGDDAAEQELGPTPSLRLVWHCAKQMRSIEPLLQHRPQGPLVGRVVKNLPGLGAAGAFVSEMSGLRKVVRLALTRFDVGATR